MLIHKGLGAPISRYAAMRLPVLMYGTDLDRENVHYVVRMPDGSLGESIVPYDTFTSIIKQSKYPEVTRRKLVAELEWHSTPKWKRALNWLRQKPAGPPHGQILHQ